MDSKATVKTPMEGSMEGIKGGSSAQQKDLTCVSPMEKMPSSVMASTPGDMNGLKDGPWGAYPRSAGATGPAEKVMETEKQAGNASMKTPMSSSDIPRQ